MASWWAAIHGYNHPVLTPRCSRPARPDGARHVRRPDPRSRPSASRSASCASPPGADPGLLLRLGLGGRRGRHQDGAAVLARAAAGRVRTRLLTIRGGYHGDTFGAMCVCDPVTGMHQHLHVGAMPRRAPASVRRAVRAAPGRFGDRIDAERQRRLAALARRARATRSPPSSSSRSCRAPAACGSTRRSTCAGCAALCDRHDVLLIARRDRHRLRPHGQAVRRASTPGSRPTSCASARR